MTKSFDMMNAPDRSLFTVVLAPQTYKNLAYLLVGFPLAITYFVIVVAGLSAGIGLAVVGVGLVLLWLTCLMARGFVTAQRELAVSFLGRRIAELPEDEEPVDLYAQFITPLLNPFTWKMVGYLLANFVVSTLSFAVTIVLMGTTLGFLMSPLLYQMMPMWGGCHRHTRDYRGELDIRYGLVGSDWGWLGHVEPSCHQRAGPAVG